MKKNKRFLTAGMACALSLSLFAGCGGTADTKETQASSVQTEAKGSEAAKEESKGPKKLVIGSGQSCSTLDVNNGYDAWYHVRYGVCQTLTKMNDDMSISGWIAEDDYSVSEDYKTWTFTIKDGVTFSNGDPCDANAVKDSLENVFENGVRGTEYFTPVSIEADGQTLTITCEHAEPILPNKLADPLFCIIDTSQDLTDIAEKGPIGTSPFIFKSFDSTTSECVVVKNENYYGGEVLMDEIDFIYTEDQSAISMGLQSGSFDAVYNLSMTDIGDYEGNSDYSIVRTASGRTTHGFMNQKGVLGDINLRKAILMYLDRETFCDVLLNGQYVAGKTIITSSADYGYDELTDPAAYNPEEAEKILDEAGYLDVDSDGYREDLDGNPMVIDFVYYQGRPEQQIIVEASKQELQKIGININIVLNESSQVMNMLKSGEYDLLCMSINVMNCADPENHFKTYFMTGGSYASSGFDNEAFDALIEKLSVTADAQERKDIVKEAEQIILDEVAAIPFCYPLMNFVTKNTVSGITCSPADYYWVSEATDIN